MVCGDLRIFFEENLASFYACCDGGASAPPAAFAERCQNRISLCFSLVDSVLEFLIGDVSAAESGSESDPLWSLLPATALLAIQKVPFVTREFYMFYKV